MRLHTLGIGDTAPAGPVPPCPVPTPSPRWWRLAPLLGMDRVITSYNGVVVVMSTLLRRTALLAAGFLLGTGLLSPTERRAIIFGALLILLILTYPLLHWLLHRAGHRHGDSSDAPGPT